MPATIVSPNKLAAERSSMICGQCHSRPQGNLKNDQPVNTDNKMMLPGTARNIFLKEYTTREDAGQEGLLGGRTAFQVPPPAVHGLHQVVQASQRQPAGGLLRLPRYRTARRSSRTR